MGDINMDNQQAPPQQPIQQPLPTAEQLHEFITRQVRLQLGQQHHNHNNNISITNRPKPAKPPMYDGKLGTDPTVWLFQVKQYFDITNTPEATRPMIASTYLTDNAATWWQTFTSIQPNGDARAITWQNGGICHVIALASPPTLSSSSTSNQPMKVTKRYISDEQYEEMF